VEDTAAVWVCFDILPDVGTGFCVDTGILAFLSLVKVVSVLLLALPSLPTDG
jgi:hypothetical protein